jgi:hypothetical protein
MNEFSKKRKELDIQVLNELYVDLGYDSKVIPVEPGPNKTTVKNFENIEKVIERWESRNQQSLTSKESNSPYVPIDGLKPSDILVCGKVSPETESIFEKFYNVYVIPGDYNIIKPRGTGINIIDITNSKYIKYIKGGDVMIYYGIYTDKNKLRSKIWSYGDIRSFKSVDVTYYEKYYEPASGRVPSAVISTCLMIKNRYNTSPFIYGFELADLSAWDQQIIKQTGIRLCI